MRTARHTFIENLRLVIAEYQATRERLIAGTDQVFSTGKYGGVDISVETAAHYKQLISHYKAVVLRFENEQTRKVQPKL